MKINDDSSSVLGRERRRFFRVSCQHNAWLITEKSKQQPVKLRNLSMGGVSLYGRSRLHLGDTCKIEVRQKKHNFSQVVKFYSRVVRADKEGYGLEFVQMDDESHMFLQTMILYEADDPLSVVTEFQDDFPDSPLSMSR